MDRAARNFQLRGTNLGGATVQAGSSAANTEICTSSEQGAENLLKGQPEACQGFSRTEPASPKLGTLFTGSFRCGQSMLRGGEDEMSAEAGQSPVWSHYRRLVPGCLVGPVVLCVCG